MYGRGKLNVKLRNAVLSLVISLLLVWTCRRYVKDCVEPLSTPQAEMQPSFFTDDCVAQWSSMFRSGIVLQSSKKIKIKRIFEFTWQLLINVKSSFEPITLENLKPCSRG